jgi:hypothetical protein
LKLFLHLVCLVVCILIILLIYKPPTTVNPWPKINVQFSSTSRLENNTESFSNITRRFAIFSSSIHSKLRSYIFYTPIAAAAWQRIGYDVVVVFVGDFTNNSNAFSSAQLNLSQAFLQRLGVHVINFQCDKSYAVKMSQIVRLFGGYLSNTIVRDRDYILTTDSDIIPMREGDYKLKENTIGFVYNAFCCGSFQRRGKTYQMFPMSHICITKKIWRDLFIESIQRKELLNLNLSPFNLTLLSDKAPFTFDTISIYTRLEFGHIYDSNMSKGDSAWYMDQVFSSMLLNEYCERHRNITIDKRNKNSMRLDPHLPFHMWDPNHLNGYGDAHLIHDEIFDSHRWTPFKNLLRFLFNSSLADDFDFYYKQFTVLLHDKPENH